MIRTAQGGPVRALLALLGRLARTGRAGLPAQGLLAQRLLAGSGWACSHRACSQAGGLSSGWAARAARTGPPAACRPESKIAREREREVPSPLGCLGGRAAGSRCFPPQPPVPSCRAGASSVSAAPSLTGRRSCARARGEGSGARGRG